MLTWLRRARGHAIGLAFVASLAAAQGPVSPDNRPPLTLRAAISQALDKNPALKGFGHRLRAQDGRIRTASQAPPLELKAELENVAGTGTTQGVDVAEATFTLSRVIEMGDKRALRERVALATREDLEIERQAAQLDVVADVTRRFIHVASDQEQLALTQRATQLAVSTLDAVRRRVGAGRAPDAEMNRATVSLARARIEEEHAEHELLTSRHKLAATWGSMEATFGAVTGDLYQSPALPAFETLVGRLEGNPDFLRFATAERLKDAEVRLAQARARADLTVSAGVRRLEAADDQAFVVAVTMPLFTRSRSRGAVDEAQSLRALSGSEQEARRVEVNAQLYELYQELRHSITEATTLREVVLPEVEAALRNTQLAFERGRYSYLEWTDAQRELIAVQRDRIESAADTHLFLAEIERLTGEAVSAAP
jgi:cobalt-zinc-cadmium efflux system outer membrane protein